MLNPRESAKLDQAFAAVLETHPRQWRLMFEELQEQGFTELQSLELLKTWIVAMFGGKA